MKRTIITTFLGLLFLSSCNINYLSYFQDIKSPDGRYYYGLYSDFCIGDRGFLVLKLDKKIMPKDLKINYSLRHGITGEDAEWIRSKTILYNYDEASWYCDNPKIEIINKRFLVLSRGGYMFGLYDIKLEKDTFNNCCPWNDWANQQPRTNGRRDNDKEHADYGKWIEQNIHNRIANYIATNK